MSPASNHVSDPYALWPEHLTSQIEKMIDLIETRIGPIARETTEAIGEEIPEYESGLLLAEVESIVRGNLGLLVKVLRERRMPIPDELTLVVDNVTKRAHQGHPVTALIRAYRIGHRVSWNAVVEMSQTLPDGNEVAVALARPSMDFIDSLLTSVAEVYLRTAGGRKVAEHDAELRELVESVLGGQEPLIRNESMASAARAVTGTNGFLVFRSQPAPGSNIANGALRRAIASIGQLGVARGRSSLAIPFAGGIVGFLELDELGPTDISHFLERAYPSIEKEAGFPQRIGVSLPCAGPHEAARGLSEAEEAVALTTDERPVVSLSSSSLFDHLLLRRDSILVHMSLNVLENLNESGRSSEAELRETILAFAAAGQNARVAADALHCHPNTVLYRLKRVHERTGLDPGDFTDLIDLVTAVRLAQANANQDGSVPSGHETNHPK